jgi:hypothetical protein
MRKLLVAATFMSAMILVPAAARAGFVLEASYGKPYQVTSPRTWGQSNLMLTPGYAPSLPILSMFQLQLGIAFDLADKSGTETEMQLRPMLMFNPPIIPLYARAFLFFPNMLGRADGGNRKPGFGGALGVRIGIPSIAFVPGFGVFGELAALGRSVDFGTEATGGGSSKTLWALEGRVGAYLNF